MVNMSSNIPTKKHLDIKAIEISKAISSIFKARRSLVFAYGFALVFVSCTFFLAFNPSSSSYFFYSSPWLNSFIRSRANSTYPDKSHFTNFFSQFFYDSHSFSHHTNISLQVANETSNSTSQIKKELEGDNPLLSDGGNDNGGNVKMSSQSVTNDSSNGYPEKQKEKETKKNDKARSKKLKKSVPKRMRNRKGKDKKWVERMRNCNIFDGRWVKDDSYPLYEPGSCPHIDEPFNCFVNGRPDNGYERYRWQPNHCNIPRLNGKYMLEILRGKRVVFIGDSLNRNMWESMVCTLRNAAKDKNKVYEASGIDEFKKEGSYSFVFQDYNFTVEFSRSNFLVEEWEIPQTNGSVKETLRIDMLERSVDKYKNADVLVFNTGHWWTHEKTSSGKDFYQEGDHVYDELKVEIAFRKAMTTWVRWVEANVDPFKTLVVFRSYSVSHFRGGVWNSGGHCDGETEPLKDETEFEADPFLVPILESVIEEMKAPVFFLNVTRMTNFRKDAHPSIYREQDIPEEEKRSPLKHQDCSHWCLPGVPDTWTEIIYAQLLLKHKQRKQQRHVRSSNKHGF